MIGYSLFDINLLPLSSKKVSLSGTSIVVDTTEPLMLSFLIGGYTATSFSTDYLQVNLKVCGFEEISQTKSSLEFSYSKNANSDIIDEKTLLKLFKVSDPDCPIVSFLLKDKKKIYSEDWLKIEDNQILISPKLTNYKYSDE